MKKATKIISMLLAVVIVIISVAVPVAAASKVDPSQGTSQKIQAVLYMALDKLVQFIGKILNGVIPGLDWGKAWKNYDDYTAPDTFYEGEDTFETQVEEEYILI